MLRIALRDTREHWGRFLMSILAVLLATAFVGATFSFTSMLGDSIGKISDSTLTADVYVLGPEAEQSGMSFGGGNEPVSVDLVPGIEAIDGVEVAAPSYFGQAVLVGSDGRAVANGLAPSFGATLFEGIDQWEVLEGRMPEAMDEIVVEPETLELAGLAIGDTTSLTLGSSQTIQAEIVGVVDSGWSLMGATFVFVSEEAGAAAFAPTGQVQNIAVALADGTDADAMAETIAGALGSDVQVKTRDTLREESASGIEEAMGFIEVFMLVFAFIAFFVGSFLIMNTFTMLVRQRQREFALLRAVGASPGQVVRSLVVQAGVVGLLGGALGIGAGVLLVMGAQRIFEGMGTPMEGNPWLPLDRAVIVLALAVAFTVLASLLPARHAAATAPVEAMRPEDPKPERATRVRGIISAVMVVAGVAAIFVAVDRADGVWLGVGAFLLLTGVLGLGPLIVPPLIGFLALPFRGIRPIGKLARGNVLRTPKRTSATAAALTIGMTFVSGVAVLAASATASTSSIVENQMHTDFMVGGTTAFVPAGVAAEVESLESVSEATPVYMGTVLLTEPAGELTIAAMSEEGYRDLLTVPVIEGEAVAGPDEVLISKSLWEDEGIQPGDTLTFTVPGASDVAMRVAGVTDDSFIGSSIYATIEGYERLVPEATRATLFLLVDSAGSPDATRADLEEAIADVPVLQVLDQDQVAERAINTISTMMNVLYALLGLSLVIAVLSIINTLAMAVMERTREIGLMRAVGLGNGQLTGMIIVESVLTALFGTILGLVLGVALGSALPPILSDLGLTQLVIPWEPLVVILAGTVVVGVLAALWPAIRAMRQPVLEAVASE